MTASPAAGPRSPPLLEEPSDLRAKVPRGGRRDPVFHPHPWPTAQELSFVPALSLLPY